GIPMAVQRLPKNKVVSFYGSNGSFGMIENWSYHYLYPPPNDLYLRYPVGRSLDKNMKIQIDSDSTMHGGVLPDYRVPINDTVIDQLYNDSIDVELKYTIGKLNSILGINEKDTAGSGLVLEPMCPNPVKSSAVITYGIEQNSRVSLAVYDINGKLVTTLVDETQKPGHYTVSWDTGNTRPGVYFYRLRTGRFCITRKCIVL
ncbi:MAG: T9SS type A sorting domain-containing protein, partial [Bacteroidetes bacterium]|nr:T9SS type A sorting domain-containing protein [Bacteroidota bacterium]